MVNLALTKNIFKRLIVMLLDVGLNVKYIST